MKKEEIPNNKHQMTKEIPNNKFQMTKVLVIGKHYLQKEENYQMKQKMIIFGDILALLICYI
jgi:hypothetical protein